MLLSPIYDFWNNDLQTLVSNPLLQRGAHLITAPVALIAIALDIIIGLGAGIAAICTLGQYQPLVQLAQGQLKASHAFIAFPYMAIIRAIHLEAQFGEDNANKCGWIADAVQSMCNSIHEDRKQGNFFKKHIIFRLVITLRMAALLVARAIDGIIGMLAAVISILTGGRLAQLNQTALLALQAPGIIYDLFWWTILCCNPGYDPKIQLQVIEL